MPTLDPSHPAQFPPNHPTPMANPYAPSRSGQPPPGPGYGRLPPAAPQGMAPPPHRVTSGFLNPAGRGPAGPLKSSGPSGQYLHTRPHSDPPPGESRQPPAYPEPPRYPGPTLEDAERHHRGPKHEGRGEDETGAGRHSLHAQLAELQQLREAHQRLTDDNQVSCLPSLLSPHQVLPTPSHVRCNYILFTCLFASHVVFGVNS